MVFVLIVVYLAVGAITAGVMDAKFDLTENQDIDMYLVLCAVVLIWPTCWIVGALSLPFKLGKKLVKKKKKPSQYGQ